MVASPANPRPAHCSPPLPSTFHMLPGARREQRVDPLSTPVHSPSKAHCLAEEAPKYTCKIARNASTSHLIRIISCSRTVLRAFAGLCRAPPTMTTTCMPPTSPSALCKQAAKIVAPTPPAPIEFNRIRVSQYSRSIRAGRRSSPASTCLGHRRTSSSGNSLDVVIPDASAH
jgi:hypothetical protein